MLMERSRTEGAPADVGRSEGVALGRSEMIAALLDQCERRIVSVNHLTKKIVQLKKVLRWLLYQRKGNGDDTTDYGPLETHVHAALTKWDGEVLALGSPQ